MDVMDKAMRLRLAFGRRCAPPHWRIAEEGIPVNLLLPFSVIVNTFLLKNREKDREHSHSKFHNNCAAFEQTAELPDSTGAAQWATQKQ